MINDRSEKLLSFALGVATAREKARVLVSKDTWQLGKHLRKRFQADILRVELDTKRYMLETHRDIILAEEELRELQESIQPDEEVNNERS